MNGMQRGLVTLILIIGKRLGTFLWDLYILDDDDDDDDEACVLSYCR